LVPLTELKHARIASSYYLVGGREQLCWLLRVVLLRFTSRAHSLRTGEDADNAYLSIDGFAAEFDVRPSILRRLARSGLVTVIRAEDAKRSPVRMSVADVKPLLKQLRDAIGENEAAGLLGLSVHVLTSLAPKGAAPLITAARSIGPGEAPWAAIISAILAGQVEMFADAGRRTTRWPCWTSESSPKSSAATSPGPATPGIRNGSATQPPPRC
jgi:hypothetical protein